MKPAQLRPLVGRVVECWLDGLRCGRVKAAPHGNTLSVRFPFGRRLVGLDRVRGVYWRGKLETVEQFLAHYPGAKKP